MNGKANKSLSHDFYGEGAVPKVGTLFRGRRRLSIRVVVCRAVDGDFNWSRWFLPACSEFLVVAVAGSEGERCVRLGRYSWRATHGKEDFV